MKKLLIQIAIFFIAIAAQAHPGIGIVKDKKGNIFYTDLKQVWKITPDGKRSIVVRNVHTHELYMDGEDNLFGEHLWYNGEAKDTWGHYVWSLKPDGSVVKIIEPKEGFLENYSFVRDDAGNMYWVERWKVSRIKKKSPDGSVTTFAEGRWGDVNWLYASASGNVYFTNSYNLYKADTAGNVILLANDLDRTTAAQAHTPDNHNLYGIWTDTAENVYVAILGGQAIKKITPEGEVSVVYHSIMPWTPAGGVFDNDGNMWVLENSATNDVRVRKIGGKDMAAVVRPVKWNLFNNILPIAVLILVLGSFVYLVYRISRRRNKKIRAVETALKPLINNL